MTEPALAAVGIRAVYAGRQVLYVPYLDVQEGEVLAVLGPNGAGKSTLVRCLALLERPTEGHVRYRGSEVEWQDAVRFRRRTSVVFQEPLLFDTTVFENVATGLRLRGVSRRDAASRVALWLRRLGVEHLVSRSARTLSAGEARRVGLARALVTDPDVLLLDEPFTNLDAPARAQFVRDLSGLLAQRRVATLLVTHDSAEARALADRAAVLLDGEIAQCGATDVVLEHPATEAVAAFLSSQTLPHRLDGRFEAVGDDQKRLVEDR